MHLLHHHRRGSDGHAKVIAPDKKSHHHLPRPCYHCGREFLRRKGGLVNKLRHKDDHCPACNSLLDVGAGVETAQHEKRHHHLPSFLKHPLSHKKSKSKQEEFMSRVTPPSSSFESGDEYDEHEMMVDDVRPNAKRADSCPFAFTYETEEVESYQISHEDTAEEAVESYQMEWLLFDVP